VIRFRIVGILQKWIEMKYYLFKNNKEHGSLGYRLDKFIDFLKDDNEGCAKFLFNILDAQENPIIETENIKTPTILRKKSYNKVCFLMFRAEEIARQITIMDQELFKEIDIEEYIDSKWTKEQAPTLARCSLFHNNLTHWFAYIILSSKSLKERTKILKHFIKIGQHLLEMNSFNCLLAIYLCLSLQAGTLTRTWVNIKKKYWKNWKRICEYMDPLNNFKNYRNLIKYHVELNNDVIPCQEIILKDLLYHYEQFVLPKYKNYIDLKRVNKIGSIIDLVRQCKKYHIKYEPFENLQSFITKSELWGKITPEQLNELSLEIGDVKAKFTGKDEIETIIFENQSGKYNTNDYKKAKSTQKERRLIHSNSLPSL